MKRQIVYDYSSTRGDGLVSVLCARIREIGAKHIFLVRGKRSYNQCGAEAMMVELRQAANVTVSEYMDFSTNPKIEEVERGVEQLMLVQPDLILAIGGGSALDTAKLIRHKVAEEHWHIPLWAIPTTAGTGAEATHFAVVYKGGEKKSVEAEDVLPDMVLLYPPFTYQNDSYLTASTGFDALAQAIEAFWNPNATKESDLYAERAIAHIHHQLTTCVINPDDEQSRNDLMIGAYWAGCAINITKTTAPHAYSYAFTTHCGYPHGHAVAITFPFFAELNMSYTQKGELLRWLLGLPKNADLKQYFIDYINKIGLHYRGTSGKDLRSLLNMVNQDRIKNNPVKMTDERIEKLRLYIENLKY